MRQKDNRRTWSWRCEEPVISCELHEDQVKNRSRVDRVKYERVVSKGGDAVAHKQPRIS